MIISFDGVVLKTLKFRACTYILLKTDRGENSVGSPVRFWLMASRTQKEKELDRFIDTQ